MHLRTLSTLTLVAALAAAGLGATPVAAAPGPVADWTTLVAEASSTGSLEPVTLAGDVSEPDEILFVDRTLTLDLDGHALTVESVKIAPGSTLTIADSSPGEVGHLTADASAVPPQAPPFTYPPGIEVPVDAGLVISSGQVTALGAGNTAGIGSTDLQDAGAITIDGGTVMATGGDFAAGIGGGSGGSASTVTITGGDVTAVGGTRGAGIGGGFTGSGGRVVISGGTVDATGGERAAGIGDGNSLMSSDHIGTIVGADVTVSGGDVTAVGGRWAAGIGGGMDGLHVDVTVSGGTVTATGGMNGAGIGTGQDNTESVPPSPSSTLTFTGGQTYATPGASSAAVGGGRFSQGGQVTVGAGALLVTRSDDTNGSTAFGAGAGTTSLSFGTVTVAGTVEIASGGIIVPDSSVGSPEVVVTSTGTIRAGDGSPGSTFWLAGGGDIRNDGVIAATLVPQPCGVEPCTPGPEVLVSSGYDATLTFEAGAGTPDVVVRLLAPSFDAVGWPVPAAPAYTRWTSTVGSAVTPFDATTLVTGDLTLRPTVSATATLSPTTTPGVAGQPTAFTVDVVDADGAPVPTTSTILVSSVESDLVDGLTVTPATAGPRTITASVDGGALSAETVFEVVAAPVSTLTITPSASSVPQGDSLTFAVEGRDAFGNEVDTTAAVLSSSVSTDVVAGRTVTFPTASPHTITATLAGVSASVTVEVVAALVVEPTPGPTAPGTPDPTGAPATSAPQAPGSAGLASTGLDGTSPLVGSAAAILLAGAVLVLTSRRRVSARQDG